MASLGSVRSSDIPGAITTKEMHMNPTRTTNRRLAALALSGAMLITAAVAAPALVAAQEDTSVAVNTATDDLGTYLVGPEGLTLYYFTRDVTPGVSACFGRCLEAWPPLLVGEGQELVAGEGVTGTLGSVPLGDGTMIATYRGRPLYYWWEDVAPGETLWRISQMYDVDINTIKKANRIRNVRDIEIGTRLYIPDATSRRDVVTLYPSRKWKYIIIHHSATADGRTHEWKGIDRYHTVEKGYDDIGYHFGLERVGDFQMLQLSGPWPSTGPMRADSSLERRPG